MMQATTQITMGALSFCATIALPCWQLLAWTKSVPIISPLKLLGRLIVYARAAGCLLPFVLGEALRIWVRNWPAALHFKKGDW